MGIRFFDERNKLGLRLGAKASMMEDGIGLHFIPARPTIGFKEFNLNDDNYLLLSRSSKIEAKIDLIRNAVPALVLAFRRAGSIHSQ